ncbi:hypothetical protein ACEPAH_1624 [Sanghuangporus vaninii]
MLTETLAKTNILWICAALSAVVLVGHLAPYLIDPHHIRVNGITGPLLAWFSDVWLGWVQAHGHRSQIVHDLHKQYGIFVRLAPNHVSISDPDAIRTVNGHGIGTTKSNFYDAFVAISHSIFNTRSRVEHARKRKAVAHVFSPKSVLEFEPYIRSHVAELLEQWDKLGEGGKKGVSGTDGAGGWQGRHGRVWFNCMPWFNFWAFDVIGDLAFGSPFGMIRNAKDAAPVAVDQQATMIEYGREKTYYEKSSELVYATKEVPAIEILNGRSKYSASLGVLPPWVRSLVRLLPWYANGSKAVENLAGMAIAAVAKRLAFPTDRSDLLGKLQQGRDEQGRPMGVKELTTQALSFLIAGSDSVSNSLCAITYYLAANPLARAKLQKELDEALGVDSSEDPVTTFARVKNLPYLEAVINEAMRVHSTAGLGLPRVVPESGLTVCGKTFPEGTVLSTPMYTVHRDPDVWGVDADVFRPERWFELDPVKLQKSFHPFSFGPRACVGRNLAMLELLIIISSIFRRYDINVEQPDVPLDTKEGFIRKPNVCRIGMKLRPA